MTYYVYSNEAYLTSATTTTNTGSGVVTWHYSNERISETDYIEREKRRQREEEEEAFIRGRRKSHEALNRLVKEDVPVTTFGPRPQGKQQRWIGLIQTRR